MRLLILALVTMIFDSTECFSLEEVKSWFKDIYNKGSSKVESEIDALKSSTASTKIRNFIQETETTYKENRVVKIPPEFTAECKKFANCAAKLNKELDADIRSLEQLNDSRYRDRVVIYQEGMQYVSALETSLAKEVRSLADAKTMKTEVSDHMDNILNVLTDELIYSYVDDLREAYHDFNNAFKKLENDLKIKQEIK